MSLPWKTKAKYYNPRQKYGPDYKLYSGMPWRNASTQYRIIHPFCECQTCTLKKIFIPSEVVDHIIPIQKGGAIWDQRNWQAMSHSCHNKKRRKEKDGYIAPWQLNESGKKIPLQKKT